MLSSLLLHASAETLDPAAGPGLFALGLAKKFDAHLRAPVFELDLASYPATRDPELGPHKASALRSAAEAMGIKISVEVERRMSFGVSNWICDLASLHDLTVAGVDPTGLLSERQLTECLLFQSGRPVILVPRNHGMPFAADRIVVAWDYTAPAARSLAEALPLLREASQVIIATAGDEKEFATSFGPGDVLEALRLRGVTASHQEISKGKEGIADTLQAFALKTDADLLVMGAFGHSRMRDFVLGGATMGVLERLQLPTLLSH